MKEKRRYCVLDRVRHNLRQNVFQILDIPSAAKQTEEHSVHSSETSYFVCGTSVSSYLLVQRTSKHLGHNSSAHFSGQVIKHACSFSSFQLAQRTSRVKSGTRETEDSLAHWTSASQSFFFLPCQVLNLPT